MPQKYTPEFKARALKLIEERVRAEQCPPGSPAPPLAKPSAGSPTHLRNWWKQDRVDQGEAPGLSTDEAEEITKLRRENLELRSLVISSASAGAQPWSLALIDAILFHQSAGVCGEIPTRASPTAVQATQAEHARRGGRVLR
ncbi:transposase [Rhodococcus hoagii]|nr:transposase [Prescottella equi]